MARTTFFRGAPCKTNACSGHKAGFKYGVDGGKKPNPKSSSFNSGLKISVKAIKAKNTRKK